MFLNRAKGKRTGYILKQWGANQEEVEGDQDLDPAVIGYDRETAGYRYSERRCSVRTQGGISRFNWGRDVESADHR